MPHAVGAGETAAEHLRSPLHGKEPCFRIRVVGQPLDGCDIDALVCKNDRIWCGAGAGRHISVRCSRPPIALISSQLKKQAMEGCVGKSCSSPLEAEPLILLVSGSLSMSDLYRPAAMEGKDSLWK